MSSVSQTDLRFFTNEPDETLYDRFVQTLKDVQYFDVLVGYFRTSGFRRLYASLEGVEKTRVLVGLSVDAPAYRVIERVRSEGRLDFESHQRTRETFSRSLTAALFVPTSSLSGCWRAGWSNISKDVDVFELLEAEDEARLQRLVEEERAQRYDGGRFKPEMLVSLRRDLELLETLLEMWEGVTHDPKLEGFVRDLKTHSLLGGRKLVIFSESKETTEYLADKLEAHFPSEVMSYASGGGAWNGGGYGVRAARELIEANYDPRAENQRDDIRLLITTDVLAEGINLHRSNVVVNYDLPWNPTRVLQRVGRVNRVGTAHDEVFVFNFFPTAESDAHLGLEENIKAKLQAFHNTLGEDAKYHQLPGHGAQHRDAPATEARPQPRRPLW